MLLPIEDPVATSVASRCADELKLSDLHCLRGLPLCGMRVDLTPGECSGFNHPNFANFILTIRSSVLRNDNWLL